MHGWATAQYPKPNYYKVDNLAAGQRYVVWADVPRQDPKRFHVLVKPCQAVPLAFGG
jgi:hypothetical protein